MPGYMEDIVCKRVAGVPVDGGGGVEINIPNGKQ